MAAINWSACRRHTAGGLPYMLVDGPTIDHAEDGSTSQETYLMRASDVAAFMSESMPPPFVFGFYVILPLRRRMPGTLFFITKKISAKPHTGQLPCDPFGADSGAASSTYDQEMLVTIQYAVTKESDTDRNQQKPETFLEHSLQAGGEFYSVGKARLRYDEDGNEEDKTSGGLQVSDKSLPGGHLTVATLEHTLKWSFVLSPDWDTFFSSLGKINSQQTILFHNAPVGTVLFSSIAGHQKYVWNGASASVQPWSLDFKFSQRVKTDGGTTVTWNHVFLPEAKNGAKWVKPYWLSDGVRKYLYDETDLYAMFKTSS